MIRMTYMTNGKKDIVKTLRTALYQDAIAGRADGRVEVPLRGSIILRYLRAVVLEATNHAATLAAAAATPEEQAAAQAAIPSTAWMHLTLNPSIYNQEATAEAIAEEFRLAGYTVTELGASSVNGNSRILSFAEYVAATASAEAQAL